MKCYSFLSLPLFCKSIQPFLEGSFGTLKQGETYLSSCSKGAMSQCSLWAGLPRTDKTTEAGEEQELRVPGSRDWGDGLS